MSTVIGIFENQYLKKIFNNLLDLEHKQEGLLMLMIQLKFALKLGKKIKTGIIVFIV